MTTIYQDLGYETWRGDPQDVIATILRPPSEDGA